MDGRGPSSEQGPGWAACGVYDGRICAWECINTARDLESYTCPYNPLFTRVFVSRNTDCFLFGLFTRAEKKVVAALYPSQPILILARTAPRFTALQTSHVCMANASFTAVFKDTSPRPMVIAASDNILILMMKRTYSRVPMDSNTFPSEGAERSSKILPSLRGP